MNHCKTEACQSGNADRERPHRRVTRTRQMHRSLEKQVASNDASPGGAFWHQYCTFFSLKVSRVPDLLTDTNSRSGTQVVGQLESVPVRWNSRLTVSKGWSKRR